MVTCALLAVCLGLCGWMYARDRDTGGSHVTERLEAQAQARRLLDLMAVDEGCGGRCSSAAIARTGPRVWDIVVVTARWRGCYRVALDVFEASPAHGLRGLRRLSCPDDGRGRSPVVVRRS